ncbi:amino acid ABC transporter permease [bacterium]|nr:amino acid ABC transporter permease [bacterium]
MAAINSNPPYLPPPDPPGPAKWVRDNLFGTWQNILLSLVSGIVVFFLLYQAINWALFQADWRPVYEFPLLYLVGQYPRVDLWRIGLILGIFFFLLGLSWGKWKGLIRTITLIGLGTLGIVAILAFAGVISTDSTALGFFMVIIIILAIIGRFLGEIKGLSGTAILVGWVIAPIPMIILLAGFENSEWLSAVSTTSWGGLLITFLLAIGGIVFSFPIGILLALGRRSNLPVVKAFCIFFIETIRGVPLITILFMFSVILALFLPQEARLDRVLRALMAMTVFSSAYMAENIRGGLQAVPSGQVEAAKALGMRSFTITVFIVLPQAIRVVIPAIVGQFISLFKDTTLVVIVGINDLLGIGKSIINSSPEFVQLQTEVYIFISVIYWIFSYLMSTASRKVEAAMGVSER